METLSVDTCKKRVDVTLSDDQAWAAGWAG